MAGIPLPRRALLNERLVATDVKAKGGLLPDVMLDNGVLKITPIEKSTPPEAEALAARLYAMLPRIRITDLLSEVAQWTLFTDCFTHLRTGETTAVSQILMASLLADGLNLGLTRMAEACSIASLGQLAWTADWHIRDETYALALRCLINQHSGRIPERPPRTPPTCRAPSNGTRTRRSPRRETVWSRARRAP
jgi:hypothetical protein